MLIPLLAALVLVLADTPATVTPPVPTPAPPTTPAVAAPAIDPVRAEINALLEPYRGKTGDRLRGLLGFSSGTRSALDGEMTFWIVSLPSAMVCGVDPVNGLMRCDRGNPAECRLAIGFDVQKMVKTWAVTGAPEACRTFVGKLKAG